MSEEIYQKFIEFYSFCYEHGGTLKNHLQFGLMSNELLRLLKDENALAMRAPIVKRMAEYIQDTIVCIDMQPYYNRGQDLLADIAELEKDRC